MFTVHCPGHGAEVLLSERRIDEILAFDDHHVVRWRCWCGTTGSTAVVRRRREQMVGRRRPAV